MSNRQSLDQIKSQSSLDSSDTATSSQNTQDDRTSKTRTLDQISIAIYKFYKILKRRSKAKASSSNPETLSHKRSATTVAALLNMSLFTLKVDFKLEQLTEFIQLFDQSAEIETNVYIQAYTYFKKIIFVINDPLPQQILLIYLTCVFIAHKFLIETEVWYLEEFCKLMGVKATNLKKMEFILINQYLDYELWVKMDTLSRTKKYLRACKIQQIFSN